jgi:hypothetical protein
MSSKRYVKPKKEDGVNAVASFVVTASWPKGPQQARNSHLIRTVAARTSLH